MSQQVKVYRELELKVGAKVTGTVDIQDTAQVNTILKFVGTGKITGAGAFTSTAGAATINKTAGQITTEALTTAALASYTMTLTNSLIEATSIVLVTVGLGTSTTGEPVVLYATPAAGSAVIIIKNVHGTVALNGTLKINFAVFNA